MKKVVLIVLLLFITGCTKNGKIILTNSLQNGEFECSENTCTFIKGENSEDYYREEKFDFNKKEYSMILETHIKSLDNTVGTVNFYYTYNYNWKTNIVSYEYYGNNGGPIAVTATLDENSDFACGGVSYTQELCNTAKTDIVNFKKTFNDYLIQADIELDEV